MQQNDYEDFLKDELSQRQELYPPYVRLARITFSHKNANIAKKELDLAVNKSINLDEIELIGFGESNIFKIANKYRYELLLRSKNTKKLLSVLHSFKNSNASIDMDTLY